MKRYIMTMAAVVLLAACSENKASGDAQPATENVEKADSAEVKENVDSASVDGVTSATNVANSPTFNGQMIISPEQHATVSSTIGGRIHSLNIMPGKAVTRGQVIATLDNPDFIELQQEYLEASAQLEYLAKE